MLISTPNLWCITLWQYTFNKHVATNKDMNCMRHTTTELQCIFFYFDFKTALKRQTQRHITSNKHLTTNSKRHSNTKYLLGVARFRDVHMEVDQVGFFKCSVPNRPDDGFSWANHRFVVNYTTIDNVIVFPLITADWQLAIDIIGSIILYWACGTDIIIWGCWLIINKPRHQYRLRVEVFHIASQGHRVCFSMFYRRQHEHQRTLSWSFCKHKKTVRPVATNKSNYCMTSNTQTDNGSNIGF